MTVQEHKYHQNLKVVFKLRNFTYYDFRLNAY